MVLRGPVFVCIVLFMDGTKTIIVSSALVSRFVRGPVSKGTVMDFSNPMIVVCRGCQWRRVRDWGPLPFLPVSLASDTACSDCGIYVRTVFYLEDPSNV